jgi:hypothetical protein
VLVTINGDRTMRRILPRDKDKDRLKEAMKLMENIAILPLSRKDSEFGKTVQKVWKGNSDDVT